MKFHQLLLTKNNCNKAGKKQKRLALCKVHLVDKCLLVFMAVLLLQLAYSLISSPGAFSESIQIDVIIRTSAAAIFGYFLSANFIRQPEPDEPEGVKTPRQSAFESEETALSDTPQVRIGFAAPSASQTHQTDDMQAAANNSSPPADMACLQILTAAGIGLFCLIVLIFVRNFAPWDDTVNPSVTATIAQLRDFVSGSVGFLLGSPTSGINKKN